MFIVVPGVRCIQPEDITNGICSGGQHYRDIIECVCDYAHNITSGDARRQCQANRTWSGAAPTCTS